MHIMHSCCAEFDDGDVKDLSNCQLRARGGASYANQSTLNTQPFQDPSKFVTPARASDVSDAEDDTSTVDTYVGSHASRRGMGVRVHVRLCIHI